jgi:hypothetical protein
LGTRGLDEGVKTSGFGQEEEKQIRETLHTLLHSSVFNNAHRSRRFLSFVAEQALAGHGHTLKERIIGAAVFDRAPDYSTGDDPIVRVQAGDVRRRLEHFYGLPEAKFVAVTIALPTGSYCPEFRFRGNEAPPRREQAPAPSPAEQILDTQISPAAPSPQLLEKKPIWPWVGLVCCLVVASAAAWITWLHFAGGSSAERFWRPLFSTEQPVIIGVSKEVAYGPTLSVFRAYDRQHESADFEHLWQRETQPFPEAPERTLRWDDLTELDEFGVAIGDTYAAAELSAFFEKIHKVRQLRIGNDYSYQDLRSAPAVLVGAFNNRWTLQIMNGSPYRFVEKDDLSIEEAGGNHRVWRVEYDHQGHVVVDYALVARLLNSATGQFDVILGGIGTYGTEAGARFVTTPSLLENALAGLRPGWPAHSQVFVLRTSVTDGIADPPVVVASASW